jgi:hypothetical protein
MPKGRSKKMAKSLAIAFSAVIIVLSASVSFALIFTSDEGTWPDTWPTELEQFRRQSKSYNLSSGTEEDWHEILFQKREEFEEAWPLILKLKTKGAPLVIESTQTSHGVLDPIIQIGKPGVRLRCPSRAERGFRRDSKQALSLADYIKLPSCVVPEYVVYQDGKWSAASYQDGKWLDGQKKYEGIMYRARIDIVLIIDGNIVDLNRIPLPADTPIIDKRFKDGNNKADAGDGK